MAIQTLMRLSWLGKNWDDWRDGLPFHPPHLYEIVVTEMKTEEFLTD